MSSQEEGKSKRGLASASKATRERVSKMGGDAPHQKRGLATASAETRARVAALGGKERAKDKEGLRKAGEKGGNVVKERYGSEYYCEWGQKGGALVKEKYGSEHYSEIGKKGGNTVKEKMGEDYFSKIGKMNYKDRKVGDGRTADY